MAYIVCIGAIGATGTVGGIGTVGAIGTVEMTIGKRLAIGLTDHRSHRTRRSHRRLWSHHSVEAQPFQDLRIQSQKQGWNVFLDPIQAFLGGYNSHVLLPRMIGMHVSHCNSGTIFP